MKQFKSQFRQQVNKKEFWIKYTTNIYTQEHYTTSVLPLRGYILNKPNIKRLVNENDNMFIYIINVLSWIVSFWEWNTT